MNYDDVTKDKRVSTRVTDPLNPAYVLRDTMSGDFTRAKAGETNQSYGAILGQRPSSCCREVHGQKGMQTADINGAVTGTKTRGMFTWKSREHFQQMPKSFNDLPFCNPSSLKRGIVSNRHINPLDPTYALPGHSEPNAGLDAFGPEGCSMGMKVAALHAMAKKTDELKEVKEVIEPNEEKASAIHVSLPPKSQTSHASRRSQIQKPPSHHSGAERASQGSRLTETRLQQHVSFRPKFNVQFVGHNYGGEGTFSEI